MSTSYYFINKERREKIIMLRDKTNEILNKTQLSFNEFFNQNEKIYNSMDIEEDVSTLIRGMKNSIDYMIEDYEIKICRATSKNVIFYQYNSSSYDEEIKGGFNNLQSLKEFYEKNKDKWEIRNEYDEKYDTFEDFYENLEIEDNYTVKWGFRNY